MKLPAALAFGCLAMAGLAQAQLRSTSSLVARSSDGSWYAVTENEARYPDPKATLRKFQPDLRTIVWERRVSGDYPRELRAAPDDGVAMMSVAPGGKGTLRAWDRDGGSRFELALDLPSVSAASLPEGHFTVAKDGSSLVVGGWTEYVRAQQTLTNAFRVAGGSLDVQRISAAGKSVSRVKLPIPNSSIAGIELDGNGVFVAGGTEADDLPVSDGAFQKQRRAGICSRGISMPSSVPCTSGWVARLDFASLSLQALTYLGGRAENALLALAVDGRGYPVVAGTASVLFASAEDPYPRTNGALAPSQARISQPVATLSRLGPGLDTLIDSTWIEGAASTGGSALAIDSRNRILLGGYTATMPSVPNLTDWPSACGPRSQQTSWGFLMRLPEHIEAIDRIFQFELAPAGRMALDESDNPAFANGVLPLDSRVACVVSSASYSFASTAAPGELLTIYGGPFREDEPVFVDGVAATVLSRSGSEIRFVAPRGVEEERMVDLHAGLELARTLETVRAKPAWKASLTADGKLIEAGSYLIEAKRSDGTMNSPANPFRPGEEVRAYATGVDLTKPVRLFLAFPKNVDLPFVAEYVEGTGEGIVEFRFTNPYPEWTPGGATLLRIESDGVETPPNPGFIWNPLR
ncbi:MAG: hypothetical protein U0Q16_21815 [Bryobacteraceae bacterium]